MRLATFASAGTALTLIVVKAIALWMTGSTAMLASLMDSALDLAASLVNLFAVRYSLIEADAEHRFGHGKAESLGALAQGALIAGSAVFLAAESISRLSNPPVVEESTLGIVVMLVSIALTFVLVMFQRFVVARSGSVAVGADMLHYAGDLAMNAGVIVALVLAGMFGLHIADPLIGLGIALWLLRGSWHIATAAFSQLMDRELPLEDRDRIIDAALGVADVQAVHDLRTRQSGTDTFIQVHVELDGAMNMYRAHVVADSVETEIQLIFPGAEVMVHLDPAGAEDFADTFDRVTAGERPVAEDSQPATGQQTTG